MARSHSNAPPCIPKPQPQRACFLHRHDDDAMASRRSTASSSISPPKKKGVIPERHDDDEEDALLSSLAATSASSASASSFLGFLTSSPVLIMVVALAIGVCLGLKHQSQGLDLAESFSTFLHDSRSDSISAPAPTLAAPSLAPTQQQQHVTGTLRKASKKQQQGQAKDQRQQQQSSPPRLALTLSTNVTVHICRNGESLPTGTLHLNNNTIRCLEDLRTAVGGILPACQRGVCRVFDRYGYEIKALGALQDEQLLFVVLPKRHFIWPAFEVGHKVEVPGVASSVPGQPITLQTLSDSPRVFLVENFLSPQDAEDLIENALSTWEWGVGWVGTFFLSFSFLSPSLSNY